MRLLFRLGLTLFLWPGFRALAASDCGDAQRIIGPFGAENSKPAAVELAKDIRLQLRGAALVRQVLNTHLSPTGKQIIVYDTDSDDSDPKPGPKSGAPITNGGTHLVRYSWPKAAMVEEVLFRENETHGDFPARKLSSEQRRPEADDEGATMEDFNGL